MRRRKTNEEKKRIRRGFLNVKICVFFAALFVFAVIGLIIPLRPTESVLENRTLDRFPSFTLASFLNGDYFSEISTWYSDSYPFREELLTANSKFEDLYGIRGEQLIVANTQTTNDVTTDNTLADAMTTAETTEEIPTEEEVVEIAGIIGGEESAVVEPAEEAGAGGIVNPYGEDYVDAAIDVEPESVGTVYVTGNTGFELFYDNYPAADQFISVLNKAEAKLGSIANVYTIVAPNAAGIDLTEKVQQRLGSGDQEAFTDYIYSNLDSGIQSIQVYDYLKAHDDEYIYFRTDHHWTALGAYYAYTAFCDVKGFTPTPIEDFETREFPGFLGTLYSGSNQASALGNDPDTVIAYVPNDTNNMKFWESDDGWINWNVIFDVSNYRSSEKYSCFVSGDQPFAEIDNPVITDGSSIVIIKDSYANAFIPFLVDHYQHIYIVDYRYYASFPDYGGRIYNLVTANNVQDVLILINIQDVLESQMSIMSPLFD